MIDEQGKEIYRAMIKAITDTPKFKRRMEQIYRDLAVYGVSRVLITKEDLMAKKKAKKKMSKKKPMKKGC